MRHLNHSSGERVSGFSERTDPSEANEPPIVVGDRGLFFALPVVSAGRVQTTVLMSFTGALDDQLGRSLRSRVRDLLGFSVTSIFLDLSDVESVDDSGVWHLMAALDDANALGGGVAVLEPSDALSRYFRNVGLLRAGGPHDPTTT